MLPFSNHSAESIHSAPLIDPDAGILSGYPPCLLFLLSPCHNLSHRVFVTRAET